MRLRAQLDDALSRWQCHKHFACARAARTARNPAGFVLPDQGQPVTICWTPQQAGFFAAAEIFSVGLALVR
jgi:hypothetical protein